MCLQGILPDLSIMQVRRYQHRAPRSPIHGPEPWPMTQSARSICCTRCMWKLIDIAGWALDTNRRAFQSIGDSLWFPLHPSLTCNLHSNGQDRQWQISRGLGSIQQSGSGFLTACPEPVKPACWTGYSCQDLLDFRVGRAGFQGQAM